MFKNILIGQYINKSSPIHRLDGRTKLILTAVAAVLLFNIRGFFGYAFFTASLTAAVIVSGISPFAVLRGVKPVIILALFSLITNLFFSGGTTVFEFYFIRITYEGTYAGASAALRLILLVCTATLMTLTTKPVDMAYAVEKLFSPLKKIGVPVSEFAMIAMITIRFIPILGDEAVRIKEAQISRGAVFDDGSFINKVKMTVSIVVPLMVGAFRRSEALANAMDARCYGYGERTRLNESSFAKRDLIAAVVFAVFAVVIIKL